MAGGWALVTGAGRGIGAAVAARLAQEGFRVVVTARDGAAAERVARGLEGHGHRGRAVDVTSPDSVRAVVEEIEADRSRGLDVVVNNAAAYVDWAETASAADLDQACAVLEVNLFGVWRVAQETIPLLLQSDRPRLVNVASGAGSHGDPDFGLTRRAGRAASYGISKSAVLALTSTLAAELADTPVMVNAVCPGLTATFDGAEQMGARPIEEGAGSVLWAVLLPDDGPRGGFFRDGVAVPW
jgi:NAD(P)-dependent dehydrogenase (short-subunit alcohol dehydrogenase family)